MDTVRLRVYLHDECPRIGCGWRTVTALLGRKWVRITDDAGARARLTGQLWRDISASGIAMPPRKRRRRKA